MSTNTRITVPLLRQQRAFPEEAQPLSVEINRAYDEIANCINARTIGVFAAGQELITGNSYFIAGQRYQSIRRIYPIIATGDTPHRLNIANIFSFVQISGTFKSGTSNYPLPYVDSTAADNQISLYLTDTDIVITPGGGSPPTFDSGLVTLEWIVRV